jgi:hypothetical protein
MGPVQETHPNGAERPPPGPPGPPPEPGIAAGINWAAVVRGAVVGLSIIVPVTILRVVVDHEVAHPDTSAWVYPLFVLLLVGYAVGGYVGGKFGADAPLTNGTLAGVGALVIWLPIRVVIWAVREDGRGLFSGHRAALPPGQLFGAFVIAAGLGMVGGFLSERVGLRRRA